MMSPSSPALIAYPSSSPCSCPCNLPRPASKSDLWKDEADVNRPPLKRYKHENSNPTAAAELVGKEVVPTSDELELLMGMGSEPSLMVDHSDSDSDWDDEEYTYLRGRTREEADDIWEQYFREIKESEGFTINVYPGGPYALYIPRPTFKEDKEAYDLVKKMATEALTNFHDESDKRYELLDVERMVFTTGHEYYLTFTAKQLHHAPSDDHDVVKTIQALVFLAGYDNYPVLSCRIKP